MNETTAVSRPQSSASKSKQKFNYLGSTRRSVVQLDNISASVAEKQIAFYFFSYKQNTHEQKQTFKIS